MPALCSPGRHAVNDVACAISHDRSRLEDRAVLQLGSPLHIRCEQPRAEIAAQDLRAGYVAVSAAGKNATRHFAVVEKEQSLLIARGNLRHWNPAAEVPAELVIP